MRGQLTEHFAFRVPPRVVAALTDAAAAEHMSASAFARRILMRELRIEMPRRARAELSAAPQPLEGGRIPLR
jgi:hypothetical protein